MFEILESHPNQTLIEVEDENSHLPADNPSTNSVPLKKKKGWTRVVKL